MKLWLDDVRPPWKYGYIGWDWARNYDEALSMLRTGKVEQASLDHDLAFEDQMGSDPAAFKERTGYDVACWIEEHLEELPQLRYLECHSANPWGQARIQQVIDKHFPQQGWLA